MNGKLGRQPRREDPRTFKLSRYLAPGVMPPYPKQRNWTQVCDSWPMLGNDQMGDCVIAAAMHCQQEWSTYSKESYVPDLLSAISIYKTFGYRRGNPETDNGVNMLDFLKWWRKHSLEVSFSFRRPHPLEAFVSVNPRDPEQVAQAIAWFGNLYAGFNLPLTAQTQDIWCVPGGLSGDAEPGSWGGHCVPLMAYRVGAKYPHGLAAVSWGRVVPLTWYFAHCYMDEAYALLSPDWAPEGRQAPSGFDFKQLQEDLNLL